MTQHSAVLDRPSAPVANVVAPAKEYPPLTALDRCDAPTVVVGKDGAKTRGRCGAQAFVRAVLPSGFDLLFCGHHGGEQTIGKRPEGTTNETLVSQRAALEKAGAKFYSQYATINTKPAETAAAGF